LGWRDYGVKHGESIYARFCQSYILPEKFGFDKGRAHLSCLVVSGQISWDAALEILKAPPYPAEIMQSDREYVIKKLDISEEMFLQIMSAPPKTFRDYPNQDFILRELAM